MATNFDKEEWDTYMETGKQLVKPQKIIKITSLHLKTALMCYYRFKRQYLVADEIYSSFHEIADVLVDTGEEIYEIEIKISKSDLNAEKKKSKHKNSDDTKWIKRRERGANKFYICVPMELIPYAEKWIEEVNPKYGLIGFNTERYMNRNNHYRDWDQYRFFVKKASLLHKNYNKKLREKIISRLGSISCNAYIKQIELMERK